MKNLTARRGATAKQLPKHVLILGAGRMGADIALAFAIGGWRCDVVEPDARVRERVVAYWAKELARLRKKSRGRNMRLHASPDAIDGRTADLAIEAVPEDLQAKHEILRQLERMVGPKTIIATNTSSLRITEVTSVLNKPARGAGFHFSVPAHVMLIAEITKGDKTSDSTIRKLTQWTHELGKVPLLVKRDVPGMLINRIQHAMYREIYNLIDSGIATPHDIDCAVRFGFGFRYNIIGPVMSRDIHGLPVHLATAKQLYPTLHNGQAPAKVLVDLVDKGHHGVTTGRGFYEWPKKTTAKRLERFATLLDESYKRIERFGEPSDF